MCLCVCVCVCQTCQHLKITWSNDFFPEHIYIYNAKLRNGAATSQGVTEWGGGGGGTWGVERGYLDI